MQDNRLRVKAWVTRNAPWREANGIDPNAIPFYGIDTDFDLRKPAETRRVINAIKEAVGDKEVKMVVNDTLFNMLGGGDDADAKDMSAIPA